MVLEENKDVIRIEYLPKGSSDYNAVEECWRQGKDDLLVSKILPKFFNLKSAIANYYRTRRFKLDITKYLFRLSGTSYQSGHNVLTIPLSTYSHCKPIGVSEPTIFSCEVVSCLIKMQ
jgi:hypothetical protein